MTDYLWLDFETRGTVDLETHGLDRYVRDPSTQPLMLAHALNDDPVSLWEPHKSQFPAELDEILQDPFVVKAAFNVSFERNIFKWTLGRDLPIPEWMDVMIAARHLSIPGGLEQVCEVLGLAETEAKIADGKRLINMFCYPVCEARDSLFGSEQALFRDWTTDPADWQRFCDYCKRDVEAERAIYKKMSKYPLPEIERQGWILDQKINERGVPVDLTLVQNALHIADQAKYSLDLRMKKITGLDNPGSVKQLLEWAKKQGYPFNSMGKVWVQRAMETDISDDCKEVFKLRQQAAKTSWAKLEAIQNIVSQDGTVKNQFSYLGSTRCGRWNGRDIQMLNLSKPTPEIEKKMDLAVELVRMGEYERIKQEFTNEMDVVSSVIRPAFRVPDGEFDIADLNAIENRVLGWMTDCRGILDVFQQKRCPYLSFAVRLYGVSYEELEAAYERKDPTAKKYRQDAKPAVLGAGYRLSGGEEGLDRFGNPIKTGLWGYAHSMGVLISRELAHESVRIFREANPEVVNGWYNLEQVAMGVVRGDTKAADTCKVAFELVNGVLVVHLPSGRRLHYINPKIEMIEFYGKMKPMLTYEGQQQETKQWGTIKTHGGKIMENADQAISRDILLHGMQLAEKERIIVVGHCHDELITRRGLTSRLKDLIACMSVVPKWAPGLILGAEGYSSPYYKKA